jgi:alkylation response protein AidB-like acyl-CoA dehydrogenase
LYCVPCTIDPNLGDEGICIIYVPYPWLGLSRGKNENKTGVRADANCATFFDNVRVPKEWGIGPGGMAATLFHAQLLGPKNAAFAVGNLVGAFETVLEYTGDRIAHDKPIRQHAQAALILGRMASAFAMGRYYYLTAAHIFDHPEIYGLPWEGYNPVIMNVAKSYVPGLCQSAIDEAIPLMGSFGYTRDYHLEKYWRDGKITQIWIGGEHLNTFNVARGFYDLEL